MLHSETKTRLWRLDCGTLGTIDAELFAQDDAYAGQQVKLVNSCYLIYHRGEYVAWDTGLPSDEPSRLDRQLHLLGISTEDVSTVILSHNHADHTGQLSRFPNARLIMGAADWNEVKALRSDPTANPFVKPEDFTGRFDSTKPPVLLDEDLDMFADGIITLVTAPGHTAGSLFLLLRLPDYGSVILSGDLAYFERQFRDRNVTKGSFDVALAKGVMDRVGELVDSEGAKLVIGHDPDHVALLPMFPEPAT